MVGDDDGLVVVCLCGLDDLAHAVVNSMYCFCNGVVDTGVAHHVAICEVHDDEVVLLGVDGSDELVLHLVSGHLRLQVVGGNLW